MEQNWYEVLGVPRMVTDKEIKAAFRKLSKQYHPDDHPGDVECERKFKEISEAYSILSDRKKREEYDKLLGGAAGQRGQPYQSKGGQSTPMPGFDFQNVNTSFESFFGFNPATKDIVNEKKMNPKAKTKNPLDAGDLFESFMGIKR